MAGYTILLLRMNTTHKDNISAAFRHRSERTTLGEPVSVGILRDPVKDSLLLIGRDALIRVADSLQDVVDILGDSEDTRAGLGN